MAITMQGNWTLRVKSHGAARAQRFVVSGADIGNGTHAAEPGASVLVTGEHWTLAVEHRSANESWRPSRLRVGLPVMAGLLMKVDVTAVDAWADDEAGGHSALVLTCSVAADASDHVVYGSVKTYAGPAFANPCRHDYIVIDPPFHLASLCARHAGLESVLRRLHPERLHAGADPGALTPIVLPSGLPIVANGLVFDGGPGGSTPLAVRRAPFRCDAMKVGAGLLSPAELASIAEVRDAGLRLRCEMAPAPKLRLSFQQYHRSAPECTGAPYRGQGRRVALGSAITDDHGNYLFRFNPLPAPGAAHPAVAGQRPDLLIQACGAGVAPVFESAPYNSVSNLVRIDLCIPAALLQVRAATTGGPVLHRGIRLLRQVLPRRREVPACTGRYARPGFIRRAAV